MQVRPKYNIFNTPLRNVVATVGSIFNKGEENPENKVIDIGRDGESLYKEDIIQKVMDDLTERKAERSILEQQWTLNANFYVGNQYCEINTYRGDIEQLEPVYDWMEREVFNQIAPLVETRIANLKKINYMMRVKPATNELKDYDKAETSTAVLQYTQKSSDFESKKNTAIYWNELCGNCFWLSWWDKNKGEKIGVETIIEIGEDGKPQFTTGSHTSEPVKIFAFGVGTEKFANTEMRNIEIPKVIAANWGVNDFGYQTKS